MFSKSALPFKDKFTIQERQKMSEQVLKAHPESVPIVVEEYRSKNSNSELKQHRFLMNQNSKLLHLTLMIRDKLKLQKDQALYIFISGKELISPDTQIIDIYQLYKENDGFVYIQYKKKTSFG